MAKYLAMLLFLIAGTAGADVAQMPVCTVDDLERCAGTNPGNYALVYDSDSATACATGGGTNSVVCVRTTANTWQAVGSSASGGTPDPNSVTDPQMGSDDFGDWSCAGTAESCTLDANTVGNSEMADNAVGSAEISTDAVSADELNAAGVATELEAAMALQDISGAIVLTTDVSGVLQTTNGGTGNAALSFPSGTETVVGRASTDTITNKTIDGASASGATRASGSNIIQARRHATDCTSITDGKAGEECQDTDDGKLWVCRPSAGDCNTVGEWEQQARSSELIAAASVQNQVYTNTDANLSAATLKTAIDELSDEKADSSDILTSSQVVRTDADSNVANGWLTSWAAVDQNDNSEGLVLPQHATNCTNATAAGQMCYGTGGIVWMGNGSWADPIWGRPGAIWRVRHQGSMHTNNTPDIQLADDNSVGSLNTATTNEPTGTMRLTAGTGSTDVARLSGPGIGNGLFFPGKGQAIFDARIGFDNLPDATFAFRCGLVNLPSSAAASTSGVFFIVDDSTANFRVAYGNGTLTTVNTTNGVAADTMYRITIVLNPSWSTASIYVNGVLATGITNPISITTITSALSFGCALTKISGAGTPTFDVDYLEFNYALTSPL